MAKLKTMEDILTERMERRTAIIGDQHAMMEEATKQLMAVSKRLDADPTLARFSEMWVQAFITVIQLNPPHAQPFAVSQVIAQLVMDWDGIRDEYDGQFTTTGQKVDNPT
jgi:hypothetical protein